MPFGYLLHLLVLGHQGLPSRRSWWSRKEKPQCLMYIHSWRPFEICPSDMLVSITNLFFWQNQNFQSRKYLQCWIFWISKLVDGGLKEFCCICLSLFVFVTFIGHRGKVKCTLVQALRLCTGRMADRGRRGIALPIHDHGTRRGWGVSVMPRLPFTPGIDQVPIVQEAGWAPGPVWTGAENLGPIRIQSLDHPAHSQSLYRLCYPAHYRSCMTSKIQTCGMLCNT
jgi:hypothetical protein